MITLWSGNPRSGKTAAMVDALMDLVAEGRALYVHAPEKMPPGVDPFHQHLKLPHTTIDGNEWSSVLPDGAVFVVDEVQDLWRPRGPGGKAGSAITDLERHGHRGIDIFLTTQKPRLVDSAVRDQVGRHVHIRDTGWLGRYSYEWPECNESLAWKTCPLKKRYTVPKRTFGMYKSANLHTKVARGSSLMPFITAVLIAASLILAFLVYRTIKNHLSPKAVEPSTAASSPAVVNAAPAAVSASSASLRWPVYDAAPVRPRPEPLEGRALELQGGYSVGRVKVAYFGLLVDGTRVATVSLAQVVAMGYAYTELGPCAGVLRYRDVERLVTCGKPSEAVPEPRMPSGQGEGAPRPPVASQVAAALF